MNTKGASATKSQHFISADLNVTVTSLQFVKTVSVSKRSETSIKMHKEILSSQIKQGELLDMYKKRDLKFFASDRACLEQS